MATFNMVHSQVALDVVAVDDRPSASKAEAVERLRREIAGTFPGFGIRNLRW